MDITLTHGIEYDVTEPVAIEDLIKSLEANARLMRTAGTLLEAITPDIKFETKKIYVINLRQESPLRELFAFAAVITYQKDLERECQR